MSYLSDPKLCKRCQIGIDDDGDGNCAMCAHWSEVQAAYARLRVVKRVDAALDAQRERIKRKLEEVL